ncbi:MAG: hypothetical protein KFB93_08405 [Simkaniaceae bacterium]|nr:MAG: hypothetical protein KFB93_08405 [Simkaniaceae bacterium]
MGKFCYIGKLALDEYFPIDQRILGLAAIVLTTAVSMEKGITAFKWVPEFLRPVAITKANKMIQDYYMEERDGKKPFKSREDYKKCILYLTLANTVSRCFNIYLRSTRNPNLSLKAAIPHAIAMGGYQAFFNLCGSLVHSASTSLSKKYAWEITATLKSVLGLLFSYSAAKGIGKAVGSPVLVNWKFVIMSSSLTCMTHSLLFSPNSPFKETQE